MHTHIYNRIMYNTISPRIIHYIGFCVQAVLCAVWMIAIGFAVIVAAAFMGAL